MFKKPSIVSTVKKVMPSVVSIVVTKNFENFKKDFSKAAIDSHKFSIDDIPEDKVDKDGNIEVGGGSGFIVNKDGTILTNRHVIAEPDTDYLVILSDGRKFDAKVIARDPLEDIAILKIDPGKEKLPIAEMSKSKKLELGQGVLSFGNVLGVFQNTVSYGIVSGLSRSIQASIDSKSVDVEIRGLIQTDAAINPGNSGGPLTDTEGNVIGINIAVVSGVQNIGFAIPIKVAQRDLEDLKKYGHIRRPFLGVRYLVLDDDVSSKFNQEFNFGALVLKEHSFDEAVVKNSPADEVGIKEGDIILKWNGEKITADKDIQDQLSDHGVGDEIELEIYREGETFNEKVELAERK